MSAQSTDLLKFREDIQFKTTNSLKQIAATLSTQHNLSGFDAYSQVRLFVIVIDANNQILLSAGSKHGSYNTTQDFQPTVLDLPGVDIDLDNSLNSECAIDYPDAPITAWTYAVVTAELGPNQVYGGLQILHAAGAAPPDNKFREQAVTIFVACWVKEDIIHNDRRCTSVRRLASMSWLSLDVGEVEIEEVFRKLGKWFEWKKLPQAKSDVRTTFEGRTYFIGGTVTPMLTIEAEPCKIMSRLEGRSLPTVALKVDGRRYVQHKHFARSKPATKYREDLRRREQMRNGTRLLRAVGTHRLALEDLQDALGEAELKEIE